jgi:hypothetical protein
MSYTDAMADADRMYAPVVDALTAAGYKAEVTQTGGMCLAVEVYLNEVPQTDHATRWLLITDDEGPLPWDGLDTVTGFCVGYHGPENNFGPGYGQDYNEHHPEEFMERDVAFVAGNNPADLIPAISELLARPRPASDLAARLAAAGFTPEV